MSVPGNGHSINTDGIWEQNDKQRIWTWAPSFSGQVLYWWSSLTPVWTYNAHTYTIHMYPPCKKHIHLILFGFLLLFLLYRVKGYPDKSKNNTAEPHEFNHPWFQTLIMFIGKKTFYSTTSFISWWELPWQRIHVDYFKFLKVMWHALIPPPNQQKNKKKLVIYDKGMLIQQLMFLKLFKL